MCSDWMYSFRYDPASAEQKGSLVWWLHFCQCSSGSCWPSLLPGNVSGSDLACCLTRPAGYFQLLPSQSCIASLSLYLLFFPSCRTLHLSFFNVERFLFTHFLSISAFPFVVTLPLDTLAGLRNLVASANYVKKDIQRELL